MLDSQIILSKRREILSILAVVLLLVCYLILESSILSKLIVIILSFSSISIFVQSKYSDFNFQRTLSLFLISSSSLYLIAFHYNFWLTLGFCIVTSSLVWLNMFKIDILRYSFAAIIFQTLLILVFSSYNFAFYTRASIITLICLLIYQGVIWQINLGRVRPKIIWQRAAHLFWLILIFLGMFAVSIYLQHSINVTEAL